MKKTGIEDKKGSSKYWLPCSHVVSASVSVCLYLSSFMPKTSNIFLLKIDHYARLFFFACRYICFCDVDNIKRWNIRKRRIYFGCYLSRALMASSESSCTWCFVLSSGFGPNEWGVEAAVKQATMVRSRIRKGCDKVCSAKHTTHTHSKVRGRTKNNDSKGTWKRKEKGRKKNGVACSCWNLDDTDCWWVDDIYKVVMMGMGCAVKCRKCGSWWKGGGEG